jgi:hypothetical protein
MVTYLPIPSPFVRLAGHWVDDALSFAMGWNYFLTMGKIFDGPRALNQGLTVLSIGNPIRNRCPQCASDLLD